MNKTISLFAVLAVLVAASWAAAAFATEPTLKGWDRPYEVREIIGTIVKNPQGDFLGRVTNFVFDPEGRIDFVIVSPSGYWRLGSKTFAVPFGAFQYDKEKRHLVLDISRGALESAPVFQRDQLGKEEWAEGVYRYYGLQPYWTERESGEGIGHPMGGPMERHPMMGYPYPYE